MNFKRNLILLCCISLVVSGCAGKTAHPVQANQPGDEYKSCSSLIAEMDEAESAINKLLPKENKTGKNVILGAAGAFLLVPWFFMDFSDAEKVEIDAYRVRYNHLARIYNDKKCGVPKKEISRFEKQKIKNK